MQFLIVTSEADSIKGELLSESSMGQTTELTVQQLLSGLQASGRAAALGLNQEQVASLSEPANFSKQKSFFHRRWQNGSLGKTIVRSNTL